MKKTSKFLESYLAFHSVSAENTLNQESWATLEPVDGYCGNCKLNPERTNGRCDLCHRYIVRTGRERPDSLIDRLYDRRYSKVFNG